MALLVAVFKLKKYFPGLKKTGKNNTPYKPARLVNYACEEFPNGDPSKRWYIVFYAWSDISKKLERKRFTQVNDIQTPSERKKHADKIILEINNKLYKGQVVAKKEVAKIGSDTIENALDKIIEIKKSQLRASSIHGYENTKKFFIEWIKTKKLDKLKVKKLNRGHILEYLDHLTTSGRGNRSRNNHLTQLGTFFMEIKKRDYKIFEPLPTFDITKLPVEKRKHKAYSAEQMANIRQAIEKNGDKQLLLFISFIYYLLARPNEIIQMPIKNIDLANDRLYIPPGHSKNRTGDYVDIYPPLKQMILDSGVMEYPEDYYIFGRWAKTQKVGTPGTKTVGAHYFYEKLMKVIKKLKLDKQGYDMYSFKHTGVCNLQLSGVDIRDIQRQCRHKSMTQTLEYMRDLDLFRTKDHFDKVKAF